jgi:hypothetical protein
MVKQVESKSMIDAIAAVKDDEITFAKLNNFIIKKNSSGEVRIYHGKPAPVSFPVDHDFACFIETFEKSDLKTGMIVRTRDGYKYIVIDNRLMHDTENLDLRYYKDDLTHSDINNKKMDIIKIYKSKPDEVEGLDDYFDTKNLNIIASINVIKD